MHVDIGATRVTFEPDRSQLSLALGGMALQTCVSAVVLDGGTREDIVWEHDEQAGADLTLRGKSDSGSWALRMTPVENTRGVAGVRLDLTGTTAPGALVTSLVPLMVKDMPAEHILSHGRTATGCSNRSLLLPGESDVSVKSSLFTTVTDQGRTFLFAQPLVQENPSFFQIELSRTELSQLTVQTPFDLPKGGELAAEPVFLFVDDNGHGLVEAWADAQVSADFKPAADSVVGWNTWDYYRWTVTEEAVLRNAEFIASDPVLSRHVKRIVIDDGWQYCYGEWDANPLFPNGMAWMAKRLKKMGFEPGLWLAPALIEPQARIAQWDEDMLARGRSGLPCFAYSCMERQAFLLDPTVEKSRKWVYDLIARYADMGFTYFKLDFLRRVLNAPCFADPSVSRGQLVHKLLEPAREAVRGRGTIMGCGYDFHAGTDLVDAVRTSGDIHARWDSILGNVSSIAGRWWAQGRWWNNDPDFALARGPETSNDPDLVRLKPNHVFVTPEALEAAPHWDYVLALMSLKEAQTLLSLVIVSGGAVNLSDDLTKLNDAGLDLLRRTVAAPRGQAGVPLDLFSTVYPARWMQQTASGHRVLLVNWSDERGEFLFDLRSHGISKERGRNFWTDEPVHARGGVITAELPAHGCLLVEF